MSHLIRQLCAIVKPTRHLKLTALFARSPKKSLMFWILSGCPLDEMPEVMRYQAFKHGYVNETKIREYMRDRSDLYNAGYLLFEREIRANILKSRVSLKASSRVNEYMKRYEPIGEDDVVLYCSRFITNEIPVVLPILGRANLEVFYPASAAIIADDLKALLEISSGPRYQCMPEYFMLAARHGAIRCFRFLALNGCTYEQSIFDNACEGGNTEIFQMCLENGCVPSTFALRKSIAGMQFEVSQWLIEIGNVQVNGELIVNAFECGNDVMFKYLLDCGHLE